MFENVVEKNSVAKECLLKKSKNHKSKKSKNRLVDLFGSTLDDLEFLETSSSKTKNGIGSNRRHTFPVSLNLTEELLKPLKVHQKRKSESNAHVSNVKIQKVERLQSTATTSYINFECHQDSPLLIPPTYVETAKETRQEEELGKVTISKACIGTSETVQSLKTVPIFVDLTKEDSFSAISVIQVPIKSEAAQTVSEARSMPLLSPISPAEPAQIEAELPFKTSAQNSVLNNQGEYRTQTEVAMSSKPKIQNPVLNVQNIIKPNLQIQAGAEVPFQPTVQNSLSNRQYIVRSIPQQRLPTTSSNPQVRPQANQFVNELQVQAPYQGTGGSIKIQNVGFQRAQITAQSIVQAAQQQQQLNHASYASQAQTQNRPCTEASNMPHSSVPRTQGPPSQFPTQGLPLQYPTQGPPPQYPPQLYRLQQLLPAEFLLISNLVFAQKIANYICKILEIKMQVTKFYETVKLVFPPDMEKEHHYKLQSYFVEVVNMFGRKLISELSTVDVQNFAVIEVFKIISAKLGCLNYSLSMYGACFYTNYMLQSNTALCYTPFLKKFLNAVQMAMKAFEKKSEKVPVISVEQKKILESQIREYLRIDNWLKANLGNPQTQKRKRSTQSRDNLPKIILLQNMNLNKNNEFQNITNIQTITEPVRNPIVETTVVSRTSTISNASEAVNSIVTGLVQSQNVAADRTPQTQNLSANEAEAPPQISKDLAKVLPQISNDLPEVPSRISNDFSEVSPQCASDSEVSSTGNNGSTESEEVIDLTGIDECNDVEILEEIIEFKTFPFKIEKSKKEEDESCESREVVSPTDSGVGSPGAPSDNEGFKCLCGKRAIYVCACNSSMYCSRDCQAKDWIYHHKLCHKLMS